MKNIKELSLGKTDSLLENKFSCHCNGPFPFSSEFYDESWQSTRENILLIAN